MQRILTKEYLKKVEEYEQVLNDYFVYSGDGIIKHCTIASDAPEEIKKTYEDYVQLLLNK